MPAKMAIECPAPGCRNRFEDRDRASLIQALGADTAAVEVNRRQESATSCPRCGKRIEFGLLLLDDDGVWRVSEFAGHAEDVTVMRPPGGGVSYEAPRRESVDDPSGLTPGEVTMRDRARAVLEGRTPGVALGLRRDVLELALDAGVLGAGEAGQARDWLDRRPG